MDSSPSSTPGNWASLGWQNVRRLFSVIRQTRGLRLLLVGLLAVDLAWIAFFAVAKTLYNLEIDEALYERRSLRITTDRSIPEWFNYAKTLAVVILLARLAGSTRQWIYGSLAVLFSVILLDDAMGIHEAVGGYFKDLFDFPSRMLGVRGQDAGEVITWTILGAVLVPLLLLGVARSRAPHRGTGLALLFPFAVLLFCAIFVDQLYTSFHDLFFGAGILLDMVEDGGEMIAISTACVMVLAAGRTR